MYIENLERNNTKKIRMKSNSSLINNLFLCCFGTYVFFEIMLSTEMIYILNSDILSFFRYSAFIVFFFFLILNETFPVIEKQTIYREQIILVFLELIGFLVFINSKNLHFLVYINFIYGLSKCDFKKVLKMSLFVMLFAFILTLLMSIFDFLPNITYSRDDRIRYSLGFGTSTLAQGLILFIYLAYFGLKGIKTSIFVNLITVFFSMLVYIFTDARSALVLTLLLVLVAFLIKIKEINILFKKIVNIWLIKDILILLPIISLFISLIVTYLLYIGNDFAIYLNGLLSTRIRLQLDAFMNYDFSFFGNEFDTFVNNSYAGVDNCYLFIYFNYGFIPLLIVLFGLSYLMKRAIDKHNLSLIIILCLLVIYSLTDPYLIDFKYNPYSFLIGILFFRRSKSRINFYDYFLLKGGIYNGEKRI